MFAQALSARRPVLLALAAGLALLGAPPVSATTLNWNITTNGNAGTASNWSPVKVPTASDNLIFGKNASYTVTFDNTVPASLQQVVDLGGVSLLLTVPHTIGQDWLVGAPSGLTTTTSLLSDTLSVTTATLIGNATGETGTANVIGSTSLLRMLAGATLLAVGHNGAGTLQVKSGGRVSAQAGPIVVGNVAGSSGTLHVFGVETGSTARSSLSTSSGTTGDLVVGNNGAGLLQVTHGASAFVQHNLSVGAHTGATGTATASGDDGGSVAANLTVTGETDVAVNPGAGGAGTGTLEVLTPAHLTAIGGIRVGDPDGGTGTLRVRSGAMVTTTNNGIVFQKGHGVLDWDGGTIDVKGGTFDPPDSTLDLDSSNPEFLTLEGGTTLSLFNSPFNAYTLVVGDSRTASLTVMSSSQLQANATLAIGLGSTADGAVTVYKGGAIAAPGPTQLFVGAGGTGTLSIGGTGGVVNATAVSVAAIAGSHGTLDVTGTGALLNASSLGIGGLGTAAGGTASATVGSGGAIALTGDATTLRVFAGGTLTVNGGGTVTAPNETDVAGHLAMNGGTLSTGLLLLQPGNSFGGAGTVNARIDAGAGSQVIAASGTGTILVMGDTSAVDGFFNAGTLSVGSSNVFVHDADLAQLGSVTLDLGTLTTTHGGLIAAGKSLSGRGNVNGDLMNQGTITASGAEGLTFSGNLTNAGGTLGGTKMAWILNGGFTGSGSLPVTTLTADATTVFTISGNTSIGTGAAGSTIALGGRLNLVSGTCQFATIGTATQNLGRATWLNGGTLKSTLSFTLPAPDTLLGSGTVDAALFNNGIVAPGFSAGTVHVGQNYTQGATGRLVIEIGKLSTDPYDKLTVGGTATLGGTLDIRLLPGTVPQPGQIFTFLTYGGHSGSFSSVTINGQPAGSQVTVAYLAQAATVTVNAITVGVPEDPVAGVTVLALRGLSGALAGAAVELALPEASRVDLRLFDVSGRRVATLARGALPAGRTRYALSAVEPRLARGVYFARLVVDTPAGRAVRTARAVVGR